ncbi:hypothetical protein MNBD_ALPHA09-2376 [hydrothermal vent metagenome]|uniref:Xylose isomerase-like TIM barrel domain-containing protein n=1 Tax=hydrothermal vent metagenome TaxID=652676 RepID=A0A3B0T1Y8_9ZZZZ
MKLALCNEVIRELEFAEQCAFAAALGYEALEVAPFTLAQSPEDIDAKTCAGLRRSAADAGIAICGLHWLLVAPDGLSLNGPDGEARRNTVQIMRRLVGIGAELGVDYMVHGSPAQRSVAAGDDPQSAWDWAVESFQAIAPEVEAAGIAYCIEPLGLTETNFINTVQDASALVAEIGSPGFKAMIDTKAAAQGETLPVAELIARWMPTGLIAHVQFNDPNSRGPGQGELDFLPIVEALRRTSYDRFIAMEPFDYFPDGPASAARAAGYVRGLLDATETRP